MSVASELCIDYLEEQLERVDVYYAEVLKDLEFDRSESDAQRFMNWEFEPITDEERINAG